MKYSPSQTLSNNKHLYGIFYAPEISSGTAVAYNNYEEISCPKEVKFFENNKIAAEVLERRWGMRKVRKSRLKSS